MVVHKGDILFATELLSVYVFYLSFYHGGGNTLRNSKAERHGVRSEVLLGGEAKFRDERSVFVAEFDAMFSR